MELQVRPRKTSKDGWNLILDARFVLGPDLFLDIMGLRVTRAGMVYLPRTRIGQIWVQTIFASPRLLEELIRAVEQVLPPDFLPLKPVQVQKELNGAYRYE